MSSEGTIAAIRRYPVKSMQGEIVEHVELGALGIEGDRMFAVRDTQTNKILSAKTAKVGSLLLSCSAKSIATSASTASVLVTVGGSDFELGDPLLDSALSVLLGREVVVARATTDDEVYEAYWPEIDGVALSDVTIDLPIAMSTTKGSFTDLAALHILTDSSVRHLESLGDQLTLSMDRFRPSIELARADTDGFIEKRWVQRTARLGDAEIEFGAESPRCAMTTLPQRDLPRQLAVLQTIAAHNRTDFAGFGNFACLGIYAEVTANGRIAIGDDLTLLSAG